MNNKLKFELLWWLLTLVVVVLVILPIKTSFGEVYNYYSSNIFFIVLFITFTRYIFLLKYTFFSHTRWVKIIFILLPIPLFFYAIDVLYDFQRNLDEGGFLGISQMTYQNEQQLIKYIKYQYIFFGSGAILTIFMMPARMIISIWRRVNRNSV